MTAVLVTCGTPARILLIPALRETMSFKNTVASSPAELREFLAILKTEYEGKLGKFPDVDFTLLGGGLWYLEVLKMVEEREGRAEMLVEVAEKVCLEKGIDVDSVESAGYVHAGLAKYCVEEIRGK